MFWAYLLHCNGGRFYAGHTDDLERRIAQHQSGSVAGFTQRFQPVELVWSQDFVTREEAKAAEKRIKGWSRSKKLALIRGDWEAISHLAKGKGSPSTSSGQSGVEVGAKVLQAIRAEASRTNPDECCGILFGTASRIDRALPTRNVHPSPRTRFELDPQALIDAHRAARAGGPQIVGYYHSHPSGRPEPSATDHRLAARDGSVWAIVAGEEVRFWRDGPGRFAPLSIQVVHG